MKKIPILIIAVLLAACGIAFAGTYTLNKNLYKPAQGENGVAAQIDHWADVLDDAWVDVRYYGAKCDGVTDDTAAFNTALANNTGVLVPGVCVVNSLAPLIANADIYGEGPGAELLLENGASGFLINGTGHTLQIHNLILDGDNDTNQQSTSSAGTRSGVVFDGSQRNNACFDCIVRGFSNIGVGMVNGSMDSRMQMPMLTGLNSYDNYIGLSTSINGSGTATEYSRIIGASITENRIGVDVWSGNLNFAGDNVNDNGYGYYLEGNAANSGHGSILGGSINHNTVYGIYSNGYVGLGFNITANNIFYNDIKLVSTQGFNVTGNIISSNVWLQGTEPGGNVFADNKIGDANTITASGNWDVYDNERLGSTLTPVNAVAPVSVLGARTLKVLPQYSLGTNLVSNGNFGSGSTGWTLGTGWTVGSGVANSPGTGTYLSQALAVSGGTDYAITYTISNYTSGYIAVGIGGNVMNPDAYEGNGTYHDYFYLPATGNATLYIGGYGNWSIGNISVQAATPSPDTNQIPTSCAGLPTGAIYSNSGVLTLCP